VWNGGYWEQEYTSWADFAAGGMYQGQALCAFLPSWDSQRVVTLVPGTVVNDVGVAQATPINSLGTWAASSTLPGSASNGDYYTVTGHYGDYSPDDLIIWWNDAWHHSGATYNDFYWIAVDDAKAFYEALGFEFLFNEIVVPLKHLEFVAATGSDLDSLPYSNASGTVDMDVSGTGSLGWDSPTARSAYTVEVSGSTVRGVARFDMPIPVPLACWRFVVTPPDSDEVAWKWRDRSLNDLYSAVGIARDGTTGTGFTVVRAKSWTGGGPPCFGVFTSGGAVSATWTDAHPDPGDGHWIPADLAVGTAPLVVRGLSAGTGQIYDGVCLTGIEEVWRAWGDEDSPYQDVRLAVYASNSDTSPGSLSYRLSSKGFWAPDGDWWRSSEGNCKAALLSGAKPAYFTPEQDPLTITIARNGITPITYPSGDFCSYIQTLSDLNIAGL